MPFHDWSKVDSGTLHDFQIGWLVEISASLNAGRLPSDCYAQVLPIGGLPVRDPLHARANEFVAGGIAKSRFTSPPSFGHQQFTAKLRPRGIPQRRILIRKVSNHAAICWLEIVDAAARLRRAAIGQIVDRISSSIGMEFGGTLIDVAPHPETGRSTASRVWRKAARTRRAFPAGPVAASFICHEEVEAYIHRLTPGHELSTEMPLFLHPRWHVRVDLEETYMRAFRAIPRYWQDVLEGRRAKPS